MNDIPHKSSFSFFIPSKRIKYKEQLKDRVTTLQLIHWLNSLAMKVNDRKLLGASLILVHNFLVKHHNFSGEVHLLKEVDDLIDAYHVHYNKKNEHALLQYCQNNKAVHIPKPFEEEMDCLTLNGS